MKIGFIDRKGARIATNKKKSVHGNDNKMSRNRNHQENKMMMFVSSVCLIMVIGNIVFGSKRENGTHS